jgi:hypothetical protein
LSDTTWQKNLPPIKLSVFKRLGIHLAGGKKLREPGALGEAASEQYSRQNMRWRQSPFTTLYRERRRKMSADLRLK